ncbi:MFS transporter [Novosphingobium sp. MW5]|nr:MFS transporter [Novosphingobium sp. MW5]
MTRIPVVALAAGLALFVVQFDLAVLLLLLPAMAGDLHRPAIELASLASLGFVLQTMVLPLSNWPSDRFGTRRTLLWALAAFAVCAIGCAFVSTYVELFLFRIGGGVAGALVGPVARALVLKRTSGQDLVRALNYLTGPMLLAPAIAPPLGALVAAQWGWRSAFFLTAASAGLCWIVAYTSLPKDDSSRITNGFPWALAGFGSVGLVGALVGFDRLLLGQSLPAQMTGALLFAVGAGCLLTAWKREMVVAPDASILARRCFAYPTFATMLGAAGFAARIPLRALPILLPLHLQLGLGMSLRDTGLAMAGLSIGDVASRPFIQPILAIAGVRKALIALVPLAALSMAVLVIPGSGASLVLVASILFCAGFARAVLFMLMSALALVDVPREQIGPASSAWNIFQQATNSVATTLCSFVLVLFHQSLAWDMQAAGRACALVLAGLLLTSLPMFAKLKPDAGQKLLPASGS